ncbi:hypothetical protein L580_3194 [Serratia fonticola AU-P3(3)]|nr:hypothetical protein L580_3194 [Serratia fonticola AU-P3(3)]
MVDGQKNRRIIPPFAPDATTNSRIEINKRAINSIEDEKFERAHMVLANVCLRC